MRTKVLFDEALSRRQSDRYDEIIYRAARSYTTIGDGYIYFVAIYIIYIYVSIVFYSSFTSRLTSVCLHTDRVAGAEGEHFRKVLAHNGNRSYGHAVRTCTSNDVYGENDERAGRDFRAVSCGQRSRINLCARCTAALATHLLYIQYNAPRNHGHGYYFFIFAFVCTFIQ